MIFLDIFSNFNLFYWIVVNIFVNFVHMNVQNFRYLMECAKNFQKPNPRIFLNLRRLAYRWCADYENDEMKWIGDYSIFMVKAILKKPIKIMVFCIYLKKYILEISEDVKHTKKNSVFQILALFGFLCVFAERAEPTRISYEFWVWLC